MTITFDAAKRERTRRHRGLDFIRANEVFAGRTATVVDDRRDYGETRFITAGQLEGRLVVWTETWRGASHHLDEALSCRRRGSLAPPHGVIVTTRRC